MKTTTLIIKDITNGTVTYHDGGALKIALEKVLNTGNTVILSFKDINTISSSFLNASLGDIIDRYGFEVLKNRIKITQYTTQLLIALKKYIQDLKDSITA